METMILINLINGIGLFLAFGLLYSLIVLKSSPPRVWVQPLLMGSVLGATGIILNLNSWAFGSGVFFWLSPILFGVAALALGVGPTLLGVVVITGFEFYQGGLGLGGVAAMIAGGIGLVWGYIRQAKRGDITTLEWYVLGLVVQSVLLVGGQWSPWSLSVAERWQVGLWVILIYPGGTVFFGKLLTRWLVSRPEDARWLSEKENLDYKFLADASSKLVGFTTEAEVFDYISLFLSNLLPNNVVILITKTASEGNYLKLIDILGLNQSTLYQAIKLLGFDPVGKEYVVIDEFKTLYCKPVLQKIEGGFYEFSANETPKFIADTIERLLNIKNIYTIGIADEGVYFGYIHFLTSRSEVNLNKRLLESFIYQCFLALSKIHSLQQLIESEAKFRTLIENFHSGVVVHNPDSSIVLSNPMASSFLGLTVEQMKGKTAIDPVWSFVNEGGQPMVFEDYPVNQVLRSGQPFENQVVGVLRSGQESPTWGLCNAYPVWGQAGELLQVVVTFIDITERKRAEEALRTSNEHLAKTLKELKETQERIMQQERLAAVGQLAAGVAHDFNNILTSMLGFAELSRRTPDTPETVQADLSRIIKAGQRAAHLVRQLLDFSRKSIRQPKQFDLAPFTAEMVEFIERTIPENIQIALSLAPGDYWIQADPIQIQQVITNLAINAGDAMPIGGELRIAISRVVCNGNIHCVLCNQPIIGEWAKLEVVDTGDGIATEVLPRIFEPFFTTKAVGQGTGLGLSQVAGIVGQHQGHATVESQLGQGTTFAIYLPIVTSTQVIPEPGLGQMEPGQGETILVVEDEPVVLQAITAMLESLNYRVLTTINGHEALAVYREHNREIGLVLSDMVMPDMVGEELFHALKAQDPWLKMIMMSGYPLDKTGATLLEQGVVAWFEKPISFEKLAQVVGQALSFRSERQ